MGRENVRGTDPSTSREAAREISRRDLATVYRVFHLHNQLADFQLEALLGGAMNGKWRKRRSDLLRERILEDSGRKILNPHTLKSVIVWSLVKQQPVPKSTADTSVFGENNT
jgi:hypothetical protein